MARKFKWQGGKRSALRDSPTSGAERQGQAVAMKGGFAATKTALRHHRGFRSAPLSAAVVLQKREQRGRIKNQDLASQSWVASRSMRSGSFRPNRSCCQGARGASPCRGRAKSSSRQIGGNSRAPSIARRFGLVAQSEHIGDEIIDVFCRDLEIHLPGVCWNAVQPCFQIERCRARPVHDRLEGRA